MRGDTLRGHLDMLVLSALRDEPAHGYEVIQRLRERSDQLLDLPEGSIYPALHRLERAGFLKGRWEQGAGPRRRVYRVTPKGERELARQQGDWQALVKAISAVMEGT